MRAGAARSGSVKAGGHRAYGEPEDKAQNNFTDPDSAKTGAEGFQQCYNAQVAGRASVDRCDRADEQCKRSRGGAAR